MNENDKKYEARYWRSLYENLRRKDKAEIENLKYTLARFSRKTYELLELLGLSHQEIINYYKLDVSILKGELNGNNRESIRDIN